MRHSSTQKKREKPPHPLDSHILWYIGAPNKELTWKDNKTGELISGSKEKDGQATYQEVKRYLYNYAKVKCPISRATIQRRLKALVDAGLIENLNAVPGDRSKDRGKRAIYRLTAKGKEPQYFEAQYYDLKIKLSGSGILGRDVDHNTGKLHYLSLVKIAEENNVQLLTRAIEIERQKGSFKEFYSKFVEVQQAATLTHCLNILNSSVQLILKEKFSAKEIQQLPEPLSQLLKILTNT